MPRIVVRAADTALAMDEVIDRLGPGAFILSTRSGPGGVEIEATSDPVPTERPGRSFAEEFEARMQAAALPPALAVGGQAWLVAVADGLSGRAARSPLDALADLYGKPGQVWPTATTVLVGPDAEALDQTAMRLAVSFRRADPECSPELVAALRPGAVLPPTLLAWARLMGLSHAALKAGGPMLDPATQPRLVTLPADCGITPATLGCHGAEILFVLPTGQHPRRLARILAPWCGTGAGVCLTGLEPDDVPQPEELAAIADAGLCLRLLAAGDGLFDALAVPTADDLAAWAAAWCAEAGIPLTPPFPQKPNVPQPAQEFLA